MSKYCIKLKQKFNRKLYCKKYNKEINIRECNGCKYKEYDEDKIVNKSALKSRSNKSNKKNKPSKRTIGLSITKDVKMKVWERDKHMCIICLLYYHRITYVPWNMANSHYIKRSHGGLGIEEDVFTACSYCHHKFDDTIEREKIIPYVRNYLIKKYPHWNEDILVYKKFSTTYK